MHQKAGNFPAFFYFCLYFALSVFFFLSSVVLCERIRHGLGKGSPHQATLPCSAALGLIDIDIDW